MISCLVSFIKYYLWKIWKGNRVYLVLLLEDILIYEYIMIIHSNWTFGLLLVWIIKGSDATESFYIKCILFHMGKRFYKFYPRVKTVG